MGEGEGRERQGARGKDIGKGSRNHKPKDRGTRDKERRPKTKWNACAEVFSHGNIALILFAIVIFASIEVDDVKLKNTHKDREEGRQGGSSLEGRLWPPSPQTHLCYPCTSTHI